MKIIPQFKLLKFQTAGVKAQVASSDDPWTLGQCVVRGEFDFDYKGTVTTAGIGTIVNFDEIDQDKRRKLIFNGVEQDYLQDIGVVETANIDGSEIVCVFYSDSKIKPKNDSEWYWYSSIHVIDEGSLDIDVLADDVIIVARGKVSIDELEANRSMLKCYKTGADTTISLTKLSQDTAVIIILR